MFVSAPPGREPEFDDVGGNANVVGDYIGRKQQPRELAAKERPPPARMYFDAVVGGRALSHEYPFALVRLRDAPRDVRHQCIELLAAFLKHGECDAFQHAPTRQLDGHGIDEAVINEDFEMDVSAG